MSRRENRDEQRDRLLEAALAHVPFDGWSTRSLLAAARDLDMDASLARRLFPRGGDHLLVHVERWADRRMTERVDPDALTALPVRDRVATVLRARLTVLEPHREAMRRAVAARFLPGNALAATGALWRTADLVWSLAGDRKRDASWFTKRAILVGVWSATFLYWLDDRSLDGEATAAFLDRRIDDALVIGRVKGRLEGMTGGLGRLFPRSGGGWRGGTGSATL